MARHNPAARGSQLLHRLLESYLPKVPFTRDLLALHRFSTVNRLRDATCVEWLKTHATHEHDHDSKSKHDRGLKSKHVLDTISKHVNSTSSSDDPNPSSRHSDALSKPDALSRHPDVSSRDNPTVFSKMYKSPTFSTLPNTDFLQLRRWVMPTTAAVHTHVTADVDVASITDTHAQGNKKAFGTVEPEVLPEEIEAVKLFQLGDFSQMYERLSSHKAQGIVIPASLLTDMAATLQQAIPVDASREELHRSNTEAPTFFAERDLRLYSLAAFASTHIKYLHKIFQLYETDYYKQPNFLENYIWLCYHTNDLETIQRYFHQYLKSDRYDWKTLSHITNAFIYNYEVEFAKNLFVSIIGMRKPLDESYLSATLVAFTQVKASFDNILFIFTKWASSENCESPYPKTMALILKQCNIYGTASENASINEHIDRLGYHSNFFIQMVKSQTKIINKDNNRHKTITDEDFREILTIRNGLGGSRSALKAYYESYLHFFCTYSNMASVQMILKEMKKDSVRLTRFSYYSIITHYLTTRKFVPLFKFIEKFLAGTIPFEPIYAKFIFDGFLRAIPYHGELFAHKMRTWLKEMLAPEELDRLLESCRLKKINSSLSPLALQSNDLSSDVKYDLSAWKDIQYDPNQPYLKLQRREQMNYRANLGLQEILRRGICPEYSIIEDTLKNLGPSIRQGILSALSELRMTKYSLRLEIYDFVLNRPRKDEFSKFIAKMEPKLNTSDRIFLARRALNKCDYEGCSLLLLQLNPQELTDSRQMIILNLKLRNSVQSNDFEAFDQSIDQFPLDELTLSPFILKQSRFVEKMLRRKIRALAASGISVEAILASLTKLHGLIGDIEVRLEKDTKDINHVTDEVFEMLTRWTRNSQDRVLKQKTVMMEK